MSPSRQAGSGECVQGSADRLGSSSSAVQQFCGESGILLVRLAGARIAARASVLADAVRRMAAQFENHHQARGATPGDAHQQFSTTPTGVRQESAQQVYEMDARGHGQYRLPEKGSSRISLSGGDSPPLPSGINQLRRCARLLPGKMRPPSRFRPLLRPEVGQNADPRLSGTEL